MLMFQEEAKRRACVTRRGVALGGGARGREWAQSARSWRVAAGSKECCSTRGRAWRATLLARCSRRFSRTCQPVPRQQQLLDLLTEFLDDLSAAGELALYRSLVQQDAWKGYLALRGTLLRLAELISFEIAQLSRQEESCVDLAEGFALKALTELLACFLEHAAIKRVYKGRLVGAVLNGFLALRRLFDETQDKLFELLEEMTSGTEAETAEFMRVCLDAVDKCHPQDHLTPVTTRVFFSAMLLINLRTRCSSWSDCAPSSAQRRMTWATF